MRPSLSKIAILPHFTSLGSKYDSARISESKINTSPWSSMNIGGFIRTYPETTYRYSVYPKADVSVFLAQALIGLALQGPVPHDGSGAILPTHGRCDFQMGLFDSPALLFPCPLQILCKLSLHRLPRQRVLLPHQFLILLTTSSQYRLLLPR